MPLWCGGLLDLDYPQDKLSLAVLANNCEDRTFEAAEWWCKRAGDEGWRYGHVGRATFATTSQNQRGNGERHDYSAYARARDLWVGMRGDAEWLFQVDSDVQVPSDCLRRLMELAIDHDAKMVSALIQNSWGASLDHCNVMQLYEGGPNYTWEWGAVDDRSEGLKPCAMTGACVLLHRSIFDAGHRYALPMSEGDTEDSVFCEALIAGGIQPYYAPSVRATHWMQRPVEQGYLRRVGWHARLADYHEAQIEELIHVA